MHIEFGRPSCQIEGADAALLQNLQNELNRLGFHHFCPVRASVDMAVQTRLIAFVPKIDLQCDKPVALDGWKVGGAKEWKGRSHGQSSWLVAKAGAKVIRQRP